MGDAILQEIGLVLGPREAALHENETGGEISLATSTTSDRVEIPTWLRGVICEFTAITADCAIQFGDGSVDVDHTEDNSLSTEEITLSDTVGRYIVAGTTRSWIVPRGCTHMAFEATGTGRLGIGPSSFKMPRG